VSYLDLAEQSVQHFSPAHIHSEGSPTAYLDHKETLLKCTPNFIGLTDIMIVRAEGAAAPELKPAAIAAATAQIVALTTYSPVGK
jgi:FMN-dependent NADH-azoreductase